MTGIAPTENTAAERNDAYAALRYGEFRALAGGTFLLTSALLIQEVALGYELYRLTGDPLMLGLVGLAEAIPFMALALFGGHLADRREKRALIQASLAVMLCGSVVLWLATLPAARERFLGIRERLRPGSLDAIDDDVLEYGHGMQPLLAMGETAHCRRERPGPAPARRCGGALKSRASRRPVAPPPKDKK